MGTRIVAHSPSIFRLKMDMILMVLILMMTLDYFESSFLCSPCWDKLSIVRVFADIDKTNIKRRDCCGNSYFRLLSLK